MLIFKDLPSISEILTGTKVTREHTAILQRALGGPLSKDERATVEDFYRRHPERRAR